MGRIEQLARKFENHISLPWAQNLSPSERTIFVVYPKEEERRLRVRIALFQQACEKNGHGWNLVILDRVFAEWMAAQDYASEYFAYPEDLRQKLDSDFTVYVADVISKALASTGPKDAIGVLGVGTLFGFARLSSVLQRIETRIPGRLILFFPGSYDKNVFRLLDARDGWGYMSLPITLNEVAYT
jgi:Domain of unknown function (DUF1788).